MVLGALLFGIGMVIYGYCPGTGVAAMATGKLDAAAGFLGMLAGAALYALSYDWIAANILPIGNLGKMRLQISPAFRSGFRRHCVHTVNAMCLCCSVCCCDAEGATPSLLH